MPRIVVGSVAEHHALRRRGILDAAVAVLGEEGAQALTPAAVAARTGLARNSIYQYHPSTGALVAAAVEESLRRSASEVEAGMPPGGDPAQRVLAWVGTALRAAAAGHALWPADGLTLPAECRERLAELHDQVSAPLVEGLAALHHPDPSASAELIAGLVRVGADQVRRGDDIDDVVARIGALLAL